MSDTDSGGVVTGAAPQIHLNRQFSGEDEFLLLLLYICTSYFMQRLETINVYLKLPHCASGPLRTVRLTFMMSILENYTC